MNYRLLAIAIAALSSAHITTAAAQSVYVAPGSVVYVIPSPSYGNGYGSAYYGNAYYGNAYYGNAYYGNGYGYYSNAYYGNGYVYGDPYYGNAYYGNGYVYGDPYYGNAYYGNGYGYGPPPGVVIAGFGARGVAVRPGTPANRGGRVNRVGRR